MKDKNIIRKSLNKKGRRLFIITLISISFLTVNVFADYTIVSSNPFGYDMSLGRIAREARERSIWGIGPQDTPLYIQKEISGKFGRYTIADAGCSITSLSMIKARLTGKDVSVREMAQKYGNHVGDQGAGWTIVQDFADREGLKVKQFWDKETLISELKKGKVVLCSQKAYVKGKPSPFTSKGHLITIKGITPDGRLYVNDPASRSRSYRTWSPEEVHAALYSYWTVELDPSKMKWKHGRYTIQKPVDDPKPKPQPQQKMRWKYGNFTIQKPVDDPKPKPQPKQKMRLNYGHFRIIPPQ